ncbi:tetratricopeptide repeat protein [Lacibacter cauensis]|uniref:histidine kinase n=1 Tax=Lacibacter cauensis TaxID=510947 RepID=A0A562S9K1_9BACT|nr:tetratricopeptide repeat protein [Lacibacter cauensis]TWI78012.1 tetratricopeptide repeat protein [Lacibacter cauensis]
MKPVHALLLILSLVIWGCVVKNDKNYDSKIYYDKATYYYSLEKLDSAFLMFTLYVGNAGDSLKKGTAYRCMGDMLWEVGDLHAAEENATATIRALDPLNTAHHAELSYAYNLLGNVHVDMQQYDEAITMFKKAREFTDDSGFLADLVNGEAVALQKKGKYKAAVALYDSMLLRKPADQSLFARMIDNRAKTKWLQDHRYPALPEFWQALKIRTDSQYNRGLNASYAHLADYYTGPNRDSALWYAKKMFQQAQLIQSPDDRLEAIDKLIRLDNSSSLQYWYTEFKQLSDSTRLSRDTTRNRYALIRYDSQKSKADNLELKGHVTRQRFWIIGLIAVAMLVITGLSLWYNKRRKRIKQESENAIRNAQLKTSQKVHDVVAAGLYNIMNELEHGDAVAKEPLLDKIEGLYEKSRNISYEEVLVADTGDYDKALFRLLKSFANDQTKVFLVGGHSFLNDLSLHQKQEIRLILNEIMINMKKHSHAKNVVIQFRQEDGNGLINYKDDGLGFSDDHTHGNGLKNTVSRIKSLKGDIIFGKTDRGGVTISISFPLSPTNK